MKKGMIPVALGTAVTATGLALDAMQMKKQNWKKNDYMNMAGALLVGAGVAHVALGAIDMKKFNR